MVVRRSQVEMKKSENYISLRVQEHLCKLSAQGE